MSQPSYYCLTWSVRVYDKAKGQGGNDKSSTAAAGR